MPSAAPQSYYGRPVLKEPVWTWEAPAYFFAGGLAAGSSLLAVAADAAGDAPSARRGRLVAAAAVVASTGLLISDLGRPERFHHMLRVAKVTSPMSVGAWALAVYGPAAGGAAAADVLGVTPRLGRAAGHVAAAVAPLIAGYTAVLVSDTAIPVWHEARRELPFVFVGGAAASTGAIALALAAGCEPGAAQSARRLTVLGALLELSATAVMERRLPPSVARPYREGRSGRLARVARALTAGGAALVLVGGWVQATETLGSACVLSGALVHRYAVVAAGRASARDPFAATSQRPATGRAHLTGATFMEAPGRQSSRVDDRLRDRAPR